MTDDEMTLRRTVAAAERARAFIEDPLLVAAWEALEARFLMAWRNSPADATEQRERLWHNIKALAEVRLELETVLADGVMAKAALADLRDGTSNNP
jgi:hypothetical protein